MRIATLALAALTATTNAQFSSPYNLQSNAFRLVLKSANTTLDGHVLGACHQGAAIEGLCLTSATVSDPVESYYTFYHNVSSSAGDKVNANDTNGVLNYVLVISGGMQVPSPMSFYQNPGSNLADLVFTPSSSESQLVMFEDCGSMYIPVYQNDQVSPPAPYEPTLKLKNWFVCLTRYSYLYNTLVFKLGVTGEPQNPTCQAVEVVRQWV